MMGKGTAYGAISIVNAIAAGRGATVGVRLRTDATVELYDEPGKWKLKMDGRGLDSKLAVETVASVLKSSGRSPLGYSASVETKSEIPVGVGLKSSSSSSAAIALATAAALGEKFTMRRIMLCSVQSSLKAGVSMTGAFDDVAGCLLGGLNCTDNRRNRIVKSRPLEKAFRVAIRVPRAPGKRRGTDHAAEKRLAKLADAAFALSLRGEVWRAMTLNGLIYSSLYGYDPVPALKALQLGALGAGLSGKGPAIAAVYDPSDAERLGDLVEEWGGDGSRVILTETNGNRGEVSRG